MTTGCRYSTRPSLGAVAHRLSPLLHRVHGDPDAAGEVQRLGDRTGRYQREVGQAHQALAGLVGRDREIPVAPAVAVHPSGPAVRWYSWVRTAQEGRNSPAGDAIIYLSRRRTRSLILSGDRLRRGGRTDERG